MFASWIQIFAHVHGMVFQFPEWIVGWRGCDLLTMDAIPQPNSPEVVPLVAIVCAKIVGACIV